MHTAPLFTQEYKWYVVANLTESWAKLGWVGEGGNLLVSYLGRSYNMPSHFTLWKLEKSEQKVKYAYKPREPSRWSLSLFL